MANFAVITKVIVHNKVNNDADTVAGSYAKEVSDYLETIDDDASSVDGSLAKAISDAIGANTAGAIGVSEVNGSIVVVIATS